MSYVNFFLLKKKNNNNLFVNSWNSKWFWYSKYLNLETCDEGKFWKRKKWYIYFSIAEVLEKVKLSFYVNGWQYGWILKWFK